MVAFVFYLLKLPQDLSILANLSSTTACVVHILKQITSFDEDIVWKHTAHIDDRSGVFLRQNIRVKCCKLVIGKGHRVDYQIRTSWWFLKQYLPFSSSLKSLSRVLTYDTHA